jgi:hydrogenase-4 component F
MAFNHDQLVVFALIVMLAPLLASAVSILFRRRGDLVNLGTVLFALLSLLASILIASGSQSEFPLRFLFIVDFYLDALSVYFVLLVNLVAFVASWYTVQFLAFDARHNQRHNPTMFHFFFNLFHFTMLIVPMVDNLVILWIAVELTTLVSTMLVSYRRDRAALEAAWKYIIITTTGIIFALLGTLFLANAIPQTLPLIGDPMRWSVLAREEVARTLNPSFVRLSFLFILIGYGTKAGFAPMHTWLPDGHGEAPSPISALLSGVLLKSALYAILRFYTITNLNQGNSYRPQRSAFTSNILLISGLLSLGLATPFILKRNKFKRVLAYHSLEHMGIITFGIGIGGEVALFGALLHALNHALTKALMFLTFGYVRREYVDRGQDEDQIGGVLKSMPISGVTLAFGGLALVGSPPFNIFMSEFIILWAAVGRAVESRSIGYLLTVVLFVVTVTLIFGGLVGHLSRLLLDRPPFKAGREDLFRLAPSLLLLVIILIFGFTVPTWPVDLPDLLKQSTHILLEGPSR